MSFPINCVYQTEQSVKISVNWTAASRSLSGLVEASTGQGKQAL